DTLTATEYLEVKGPIAIIDEDRDRILLCDAPYAYTFSHVSLEATEIRWDFGDGSSSPQDSPTHMFTAPGAYWVKLEAYSAVTGCRHQDSVEVVVPPDKGNPAQASVNEGCAPLTVTLTDTVSTRRNSVWLIESQVISTDQASINYTFPNAGTYTVILLSEDELGCIAVGSQVIEADEVEARFRTTGTHCWPNYIRFEETAISANPIVSAIWQFGDGNSSTVLSPQHRYVRPGTYQVSATLTNSLGCRQTVLQEVTYSPPLVAFSPLHDTVCVGEPLRFINQTPDTTLLSFLWDLGNGQTSTAVSPVTSYAQPGTYTVSLYARHPDGCDSLLVRNRAVTVVQPAIDFSATPLSGDCPPVTCHFTSTLSPDIVAVHWDFGDNTSSDQRNPAHTYILAGTFTVTLTAYSAGRCQPRVVKTDYITLGGPMGTARVLGNPRGCVPYEVTLVADSPNAISYTWDFGDGTVTTVTTDTIRYTYHQAGNFNPLLILRDANGCVAPGITGFQLTSYAKSVPNITLAGPHACLNQPFTLTGSVTGTAGIAEWTWSISDGTTLQGNPAQYTPAMPGEVSVTLVVTDVNGCRDSTSVPRLSISPEPAAYVTVQKDTICRGESTQLQATGGFSYTWTPTTGLSNANIANPVAFPTQTTTYTLRTRDEYSCATATTTVTITVHPLPQADAGMDITLCEGEATVLTATAGHGAYQWTPVTGLSDPASLNPIAQPALSTTYTLEVTDLNGCIARDQLHIHVVPLPVARLAASPKVCLEEEAVFRLTGAEYGQWPDGSLGNEWRITATQPQPLHIWVIPFNAHCANDTLFQTVTVDTDIPRAGFGIWPVYGLPAQPVAFTDSSAGAVSWYWQFGDGTHSTLQHPSHAYPLAGEYTVIQTVTAQGGCQRSSRQTVRIYPDVILFPSAFSPNSDGLNDRFVPFAARPPQQYHLQIFNRWGQLVFESRSFDYHWDGSYNGEQVPEGVYVYRYHGLNYSGTPQVQNGSITLVR
ncbi:MAG: PKD domain-containing protein, partial [Bacteroidetes bacterium]|nr:PKD domain-containing protein [Bacteroidota bacterium]